jgi:hypothetical protein
VEGANGGAERERERFYHSRTTCLQRGRGRGRGRERSRERPREGEGEKGRGRGEKGRGEKGRGRGRGEKGRGEKGRGRGTRENGGGTRENGRGRVRYIYRTVFVLLVCVVQSEVIGSCRMYGAVPVRYSIVAHYACALQPKQHASLIRLARQYIRMDFTPVHCSQAPLELYNDLL